jgi:hypothetical protein
MLRTLLLPLGLAVALGSTAQGPDPINRTCGTHEVTKRYLQQQGLSEDLLQQLPVSDGVLRGGTYTVPVVVHVVYNNTAENIPTGTINALINELNQDYSATNSDINGVRSGFTNSIGNVGFQFCLAQVDPNGAATTGITRTATTDTWFDPDTQTNDMKSAPLGKAPWDPQRYLNIWICDITSGAGGGTITVGYAYLPTGGVVGSNIDGLVIDYNYGTDLGARTATHEIGHYFGLLHTFDDDGACVNADGFTDTPTSNSPTFSCTNTNLMKCGNLVQYENFMDYSNCTAMFTNQQAAYMANILTGVRQDLMLNAACSGPVVGPCIPTSTSGTTDGDFIDGVQLGTINNQNSGAEGGPSYTDHSATFGTTLDRGTTYSIAITGGDYQPDHYAAWIDHDQDDVFEATEKLGEFTTSTIGETQSISFTVPIGATLGNTTLRVRGVYHDTGEPTPTDPCFAYTYGETEDYRITIANGGGTTPCVPSSANGTVDGDFVNSVILETIENVNSGGDTEPTYTDFSSTFSTSLARGTIHGVLVQAGAYTDNSYAVWIDYDQDDVFEASEKLGEFATTAAGEAQSISFTVPVNAALGTTKMRVRGVYIGGSEPEPVDPCFDYAYGETEDYGIVITAAPNGYCVPSSINGPTDGDFIDGVQLGTINNTGSGAVDGPSYSNFVSGFSTDLIRGAEQSLIVTGGDYAPDQYAAWIDYDHDLVFEANELLGEFATTVAGEAGTVQFTVPMGATLGATRMRVRGVYHNPGEPVPTDPCYPYAFGETEDYSVVIETTTGLSDPAAFTVGIRPNPAAGRVMIDLPSSEAATIELLDLQGRVMLTLRTNTDRVALDLANVAAGSYLVRITTITHLVIERLEVVRSGN